MAEPIEPTEAEVQRVAFVLSQFVRPWGLPLNPENSELIAWCALRYGLDFRYNWSEIEELVQHEIGEAKARQEHLYKAMEKLAEDRKRQSAE